MAGYFNYPVVQGFLLKVAIQLSSQPRVQKLTLKAVK